MERQGTTVATENGAVYQHPAVGMRNKAWDQIKSLCKEFYLTPAARVGAKVDGAGKKKKPEKVEGKERFFESNLPKVVDMGKGA